MRGFSDGQIDRVTAFLNSANVGGVVFVFGAATLSANDIIAYNNTAYLVRSTSVAADPAF